jgi:DNA-binding NarL/FixJ family response regulator
LSERAVASNPTHEESDAGSFSGLTPREWGILQLASEGFTNIQIGAHLNISRYTVAQHLAKMLRRTGASNRTDLVNRAYRAGALPISLGARLDRTPSGNGPMTSDKLAAP